MAISTIRVKVYDTRIESLFLPGGDAWELDKRITSRTRSLAIATAPSRTGVLKSSHYSNVVKPQPLMCLGYVGNRAEHAGFVHGGTTGPIRAGSTRYLAIRPAPKSWFPHVFLLREVSGQSANPWIKRAQEQVLLAEGLYGH